jgi:hypothetical protein
MPASPAKKLSDKFCARVEKSIAHHDELLAAVQGKLRQAALETMLSEQFAFNVIVLWEVFLSDLLVQYLSMSPSRYTKDLKGRLLQSVKEKFGHPTAQFLRFSPPNKISVAQTRAMVDPKEYNITITSADALSRRANELLEAKYARLFTLNAEFAQFVNYIIAVRNYLAHRSTSSRKQLKTAVAALQGPNQPLIGPVSKVGSYLKVRDQQNKTRSVLIAARLIELARTLI